MKVWVIILRETNTGKVQMYSIGHADGKPAFKNREGAQAEIERELEKRNEKE